MVLPERNQVYGSFCQWNPDYRNRSPGIYACLLAARWTAKNNYRYYNLGPVGDYGYKSLFVTDFEPIYGLALTDLDHALALDETSPLHTDFKRSEWNQIYRNP
jgi:arginyl-tRNA--protein-N-Asp/Glu arginylyltransferase